MKENKYFVIGLIFIVVGIIGLVVVNLFYQLNLLGRMGATTAEDMMGRMMGDRGMMNGMMEDMMRNMDEIDRKKEFSSNGERIFYTGINAKGKSIKNSHGMQGVGCAMCHGVDAKGMKMMMMEMPDLRWSTLTDPKGHVHPNGRNHPPFTEGSFKACVLAGVDPAANQLNMMMPRWQMSNEDLDDLIGYLKIK